MPRRRLRIGLLAGSAALAGAAVARLGPWWLAAVALLCAGAAALVGEPPDRLPKWTFQARTGRVRLSRAARSVLGHPVQALADFKANVPAADQEALQAALDALPARGIDWVYHTEVDGRRRLLRLVGHRQDRLVRGVVVELGRGARQVEAMANHLAAAAVEEQHHALHVLRTRLINAAAHELGTPLTPIKIQVSLLQRRLQQAPGDAELANATTVLDRNVRRLERFIQQVLDVVRQDTPSLQLAQADTAAADWLRDLAAEWAPDAARSGVHLRVAADPGLRFECDPDRLGLAVGEVVGNAIRFTPRGGHVEVTAASTSDGALLSVQDSGPGLTPAQLEHLFEPFSPIRDEHGDTKSAAGLGLYVVRRVVQSHGGRVWAESPGKGTTVFLLVPFRRGEAQPPAPAGRARRVRLPWTRYARTADKRIAN